MRRGCFVCGADVEMIIVVWLQELLAERYDARGGQRKQRSVSSRKLRLCREHGVEVYDNLGDAADQQLEVG